MMRKEDVTAYYLQLKICYLIYLGQITLVKSNTLMELLYWSVCIDRGNQSAAAEVTCSSSTQALRC